MKKLIISLTISLLSITAYSQSTEKLQIRYLPAIKDDVYSSNPYYYKLLKLALDETVESFGPYELIPGTESKTVLDALKAMMADEGIDIVHTNTDKTRERVLLPIRIPLDKGLIGVRLMMEYKNGKSKFQKVKDLNDLKNLTFGQGHFWPDTEILRHNSLTVKTSSEYNQLFTDLEASRIDGFPRAVFEIWDELKTHSDKNLSVADGFYLYYPAAIYFFVRKDAAGLKISERVEAGLKMAIKDGKFEKLFNEAMKVFLDKAKLDERMEIKLKNPLLPENTPLETKELWYLK